MLLSVYICEICGSISLFNVNTLQKCYSGELIGDDFVCADELETDNVIEFARMPESPVLKLA